MLTTGVDLAARPRNTAACWIKWTEGLAEANRIQQPVTDGELLEFLEAPDVTKVGLDVPFGWPDDFVDAVVAHRNRAAWPEVEPIQLQLRETDRFIQRLTGLRPLSVSSDKIAVPAMRAARLFSRLPEPVDRRGSGKLLEVYPAAALTRWGIPYRGVDPPDLLREIERRTRNWLRLTAPVRTTCERSDDALDALIAALVARAHAQNLCEPIPEEARDRASREGWIALPQAASLERLASDP